MTDKELGQKLLDNTRIRLLEEAIINYKNVYELIRREVIAEVGGYDKFFELQSQAIKNLISDAYNERYN